jgi:plasmid stabilization system protein ParE
LPRLIVTAGAVRGIDRCQSFLVGKAPGAARRASVAIVRHLTMLEDTPGIGRPHAELPELRELVIPFGNSGYIALYRHEPTEDAVYVLAFRHQREAGFA